MSGRNLFLIGLIGLVLVLAGGMLWHQRHAATADTTLVYVARAYLAPFTAVQEKAFQIERLPSSSLPQDAIRDLHAVSGRYLSMGLLAGTPLRQGHLLAAGPDSPVAAALANLNDNNLRALGLSLKPAAALGAGLRVGDRVDVVVGSRRAESSARQGRVLGHSLAVLALSPINTARGNQEERIVTLAVTEDEAARIVQAVLDGEVWLAAQPYPGGDASVHPAN